jgi:CubicO group peptidase (beta-lactamase class C family)
MTSRFWLSTWLLALSLALPLRAQSAPDFATLDQTVLDTLKRSHTPGAAVAIVSYDRVLFAKGYGVVSAEDTTPITPDTLFRLGSTTKMFTAAALVTLAAQGKLKLDAPIRNYTNGLHASLARLTAHQLLSQSSGLRDFASPVMSQDDEGLGRNVRGWQADVFFTEPGKIFSYSSPGYWLAGLVAEEAYGEPYADVLADLLFKPLEMQRTTLRPLVAMTWPLAQGHNVENNQPKVIRPLYNNVAMWPGGSIFSNVNELSRFVRALLNEGKLESRPVLDPLVVAKLPARQMTLPSDEDVYYGYGLMSYLVNGTRVVVHGGASRGYGSTIQMVPSAKFAVIVLTNKSGETLPSVAAKAMELVLKLKPETEENPKPLALEERELTAYLGTYAHAPQSWEIYRQDGKLYVKQEKESFALTKVGPRTFTYEQGQLVFVLGADGKIEHLFIGMYAARKQ